MYFFKVGGNSDHLRLDFVLYLGVRDRTGGRGVDCSAGTRRTGYRKYGTVKTTAFIPFNSEEKPYVYAYFGVGNWLPVVYCGRFEVVSG